jgi:hypothetical protein
MTVCKPYKLSSTNDFNKGYHVLNFVGKNFDEMAESCGSGKIARRILKGDYSSFDIPKSDGGKRTINAPRPMTKVLQHQILSELIEPEMDKQTVSNSVPHGFIKSRSTRTLAEHAAGIARLGRKMTAIGLDLKAAFPTITAKRTKGIIKKLAPEANGWQQHAITKILTKEGVLATGSPTSPAILNLALRRADERLNQLAKAFGGRAYRYADDIIILVATHDDNKIATIRDLIHKIVREEGFIPHPSKQYITRLSVDSPAAELVGLRLHLGKFGTSKRTRNRLRGLRFLMTLGYGNIARYYGLRNYVEYNTC